MSLPLMFAGVGPGQHSQLPGRGPAACGHAAAHPRLARSPARQAQAQQSTPYATPQGLKWRQGLSHANFRSCWGNPLLIIGAALIPVQKVMEVMRVLEQLISCPICLSKIHITRENAGASHAMSALTECCEPGSQNQALYKASGSELHGQAAPEGFL